MRTNIGKFGAWLMAAALAFASTAAMADTVAKIGETPYETLAAAVAAAETGDKVEIVKADTYKFPGLPKNITLSCCDGVIFDCEGTGSISSVPNGCTVIGGTFNMGQNNYHGWQHAGAMAFNGSAFNGKFFGYARLTFTGCHFVQTAEDYCMWTYSSPRIDYINCTFDCKGKAVNVYWEQHEGPTEVTADGCTFNSSKENKPALKINSKYGAFVVATTANNTLSGFPRGISGYDDEPNEGDYAYIVTNAEFDEAGKLIGGDANREFPESIVGQYFSADLATVSKDNEGNWKIGVKTEDNTIITTEKQESKVEVPTEIVKDAEVVEKIEQSTKVEGVKLSATATEQKSAGIVAVVEEAKKDAAFAAAVEAAAEVSVKVEVEVKPTEYDNTADKGKVAFKLTPKATVTVVKEAAKLEQVVPVTNDMIDQNQKIAVSIYTGFAPATILHKDDGGELIESFSGDGIAYDEKTGVATVQISHFSSLFASQEEVDVERDLLPADVRETAVKVADGFYQDAATYTASTEFYITSRAGLEYFRDLVGGYGSAAESYVEKGLWNSTVELFYQQTLFEGKTVKLLCDVDEGNSTFAPIGSVLESVDKCVFYGIFDGCGHTIANLRIVDEPATVGHRVGLFSRLCGKNGAGVRNLTVSNAHLSARNYLGGIAGSSATAVLVTNCHLVGSVTLSGSQYVGGMIGHANGGAQVIDCSVDVLSGSTLTGNQSGGVVGYLSKGDVKGCTVRGLSINAKDTRVIGGIVGQLPETGCVISDNTVNAVTITAGTLGAAGSVAGSFGKAGQRLLNNTVVDTHVYDPKSNDNPSELVEVFAQCQFVASGDTTSIVGWSIEWDANEKIIAGTFERIGDTAIADGYEAIENATEPKTWTVKATAPQPVAKLNGTETCFYDLNEAFTAENNPNNAAVIMLRDCAQNVTINNEDFSGSFYLKGHKLTGKFTLARGTVTIVGEGGTIENTGVDGNYPLYLTYAGGGNWLYVGDVNVIATEENGIAFLSDAPKSLLQAGTKVYGRVVSAPGVGGSIIIDDGEYFGKVETTGGHLAIRGGLFSADPSAELSSGYKAEMQGDGRYKVVVDVGKDFDAVFDKDGDGAYLIRTAEDLALLRRMVNVKASTSGKVFKQAADIDMENWQLDACSAERFNGTYDGCGFVIANLNIDGGTGYAGLFGYTDGGVIIRNATISNATVKTTGRYAGAFVGFGKGNGNKTSVINCRLCGEIDISAEGDAAGIMGGGVALEISGCAVDGTGAIASDYDAGGIIGLASANSATISGNLVKGVTICSHAESTDDGIYVGGVVGRILMNGSATASVADNVVEDVRIENACGSDKIGLISGCTAYCDNQITYSNNQVKGAAAVYRDGVLDENARKYYYTQAEFDTGNIVIIEPVTAVAEIFVNGESVGKYETLAAAMAAAGEHPGTAESPTVVQLAAGIVQEGDLSIAATELSYVTFQGADDLASSFKDCEIGFQSGYDLKWVGVTFRGILWDNARIVFSTFKNENLTFDGNKFVNLKPSAIEATRASVHFTAECKNFTYVNNVYVDPVPAELLIAAINSNGSGLTGNITLTNNVIRGSLWRSLQMMFKSDDGVNDNFTITDNWFEGNKDNVQIRGSGATSTDTVAAEIRYNVFDETSDSIYFFNTDPAKTTVALDHNFWSKTPDANPAAFYVKGVEGSADNIADFGVYPYYNAYDKAALEAGTKTVREALYDLIEPPATDVAAVISADGTTTNKFSSLQAAVDAVRAEERDATILILADFDAGDATLSKYTYYSEGVNYNLTLDLGGHTVKFNSCDTRINKADVKVLVKNGTINVDGATGYPFYEATNTKVFYVYNYGTLEFDHVKFVGKDVLANGIFWTHTEFFDILRFVNCEFDIDGCVQFLRADNAGVNGAKVEFVDSTVKVRGATGNGTIMDDTKLTGDVSLLRSSIEISDSKKGLVQLGRIYLDASTLVLANLSGKGVQICTNCELVNGARIVLDTIGSEGFSACKLVVNAGCTVDVKNIAESGINVNDGSVFKAGSVIRAANCCTTDDIAIRANGKLTIEAGADVICDGVATAKGAASSIDIAGGCFKKVDAGTGTITLTGGVYVNKPDHGYAAEGYEVQDNVEPFTKDDYPFAVAKKAFVPADPATPIEIDIKQTEKQAEAPEMVPVVMSTEAVAKMVQAGIIETENKEQPKASEVSAGLAKTQSNDQTVWQNYVMGVDGTKKQNELATIGEKAADKPKEVVVVKTPIAEFNPPQNTGVTVTYRLLKSLDGTVWEVYKEGLAKPEFDVDTSKLERGDTLWKIEAVFSAEKPKGK